MAGDDLPGPVETAVLAALHRGALASRCAAIQVVALRDEPAGRARLRARRQFGRALATLVARSQVGVR